MLLLLRNACHRLRRRLRPIALASTLESSIAYVLRQQARGMHHGDMPHCISRWRTAGTAADRLQLTALQLGHGAGGRHARGAGYRCWLAGASKNKVHGALSVGSTKMRPRLCARPQTTSVQAEANPVLGMPAGSACIERPAISSDATNASDGEPCADESVTTARTARAAPAVRQRRIARAAIEQRDDPVVRRTQPRDSARQPADSDPFVGRYCRYFQ